MTKSRTKQQVACDGVRVVWIGTDSFTNILQYQAHANFSMDGVIPTSKRTPEHVQHKKLKKVSIPRFIPKTALGGAMDGIRMPWKQAPVTLRP